MKKERRQYGLWDSPISSEIVCDSRIALEGTFLCTLTAKTYVIETGTTGRTTVREVGPSSLGKDVLPRHHSIGTSVYGYGGGAFCFDPTNNALIFSEATDHGVYALDLLTGSVHPIWQVRGHHFAGFDVDRNGLIMAIRESKDTDEDNRSQEVTNEIVFIDRIKKSCYCIVSGADFYSNAKFSPDGNKICWLQWQHPYMPWERAQLVYAETNATDEVVLVDGYGFGQPRWSLNGDWIFFADNTSSFTQLCRVQVTSHALQGNDSLIDKVIHGLDNADHCGVDFRMGSCTYLIMSTNTLVVAYVKQAYSKMALVDLRTGTWSNLAIDVVDISNNALYRVSDSEFLVYGSGVQAGPTLFAVNITCAEAPNVKLLHRCLSMDKLSDCLSAPAPMVAPRLYGPYMHGDIHGFLMGPKNPEFDGLSGTAPPLLVYAHGGPTNHARAVLDLEMQYWTTRGYAVLLLNYGGSTGYGKAYRDALNGRWGALDSADAASFAVHLLSNGIVDGRRIAIDGLSAGGFTSLKALCDYPAIWAAGASLFGISDIAAFSRTTHKFESRYAEHLIFGTTASSITAEHRASVCEACSPALQADRIRAPVLILQGDQDTVVVPEQAVLMEKALLSTNAASAVEMHMFQGQGHSYWRGQALRQVVELRERWWRTHLF